jgi:hypothetical protein
MGWDHFLVRGFVKAGGEPGLITHCYNLKRVLSMFGIRGFSECCQQLRAAAAEQQKGKSAAFLPAESAFRKRSGKPSAPSAIWLLTAASPRGVPSARQSALWRCLRASFRAFARL